MLPHRALDFKIRWGKSPDASLILPLTTLQILPPGGPKNAAHFKNSALWLEKKGTEVRRSEQTKNQLTRFWPPKCFGLWSSVTTRSEDWSRDFENNGRTRRWRSDGEVSLSAGCFGICAPRKGPWCVARGLSCWRLWQNPSRATSAMATSASSLMD